MLQEIRGTVDGKESPEDCAEVPARIVDGVGRSL